MTGIVAGQIVGIIALFVCFLNNPVTAANVEFAVGCTFAITAGVVVFAVVAFFAVGFVDSSITANRGAIGAVKTAVAVGAVVAFWAVVANFAEKFGNYAVATNGNCAFRRAHIIIGVVAIVAFFAVFGIDGTVPAPGNLACRQADLAGTHTGIDIAFLVFIENTIAACIGRKLAVDAPAFRRVALLATFNLAITAIGLEFARR